MNCRNRRLRLIAFADCSFDSTQFDEKHAVVFNLSYSVDHPAYRNGDPGLTFADSADTRIAKRRVVFGYDNLFGLLHDVQAVRIDFGGKQRSAMPHDVIVLCAASGVN